ncbi:MAG: DNA topoisomerase (ATP-hydrolyzing) subunit B [Deltaproteobacteria bacterium]|nr:DNA topoisomerase (ATP-hydrolyzing) subunit B [Deltaproteobacteria bacterium]
MTQSSPTDRPPPVPGEYDASSITALEGLDAVRKRPGMYIGDVHDGSGLHHLVWEVVDNAVDEHLAGYCTLVRVTVHFDGSASVEDNGRGIPVGMHEKGVSAAEVVMTVLHAGGKFDDKSYRVSAGLHGVGVSAVNACCEWLKLEVKREGRVWIQEYARGVPQAPLAPVGETDHTGTRVRFKPDPEIFSNTELSFDVLAGRLREQAFLNAGLQIEFADRRPGGKAETYQYQGGIDEFVQMLTASKEPVHPEVIHFTAAQPTGVEGAAVPVTVEVALQWSASYQEAIFCYTNNVRNRDGGTHLTGLRAALTKTINKYGAKENLFRDFKQDLSGEDVREGLTCVLSVKHPDPSFDSQTKSKLVSSEVKGIVETVVAEGLGRHFEENPATARAIIEKALLAARAREAARKAREVIRKSTTDVTSLSGKLADCQSKNPEEVELYIVEGESAGGSAKMGRDRRFQAVLPLKGKILNVERARVDRMLGSAEVGTLITALGCGVKDAGGVDLDNLRYHTIIIMTDADVDGAHIRTLLLTFFFRQMPGVIEKGYLYVAQPPLYGVRKGKKSWYLKDEAQLDEYLTANAVEGLELTAAGGAVTLSGQPLLRLAQRLKRFRKAVQNLDRRCDARVVAALVRAAALDRGDLQNRDKVDRAAAALASYLAVQHPELGPATVAVGWNQPYGSFLIEVRCAHASRDRTSVLDWDLLESPEYQEALSVERDLRSLGVPPYAVRTGDSQQSLADAESLSRWLEARGRKGVSISRYKGLGEMNADELWETTMNPDARVLRQVRVDDELAADELFSILMGDQVEPRRRFIEEHAQQVQHLDI